MRDHTLRRLVLIILAAIGIAGPRGAGLAAAEGSWSRGAAMPPARSEIGVTELGGRVYAAGGIALFRTTAAFEVYDPEADAWRALAPLPEARHHLAIAALGGRIYATGGFANLSFTPDRKTGWIYDPDQDQWLPIADMPRPRAAHKLVALEGRLYVVGGVGPDPLALWAYDPARNRWETAIEPMPTAREHLAAAALGGKLYAVAGRWGRRNLRAVEAYDPAANSWSRLADLPQARGGHTAAAKCSRAVGIGSSAVSQRFPAGS